MQKFVNFKFLFQYELAVLMVVFVELGLIFWTNKLIEKLTESKYLVVFTLILLIIGVITAYIKGMVEVRTCNYGKYPLLLYVFAFALKLFVATVSCKIQNDHILETIGRISFSILLMHKFLVLFYQSMFPVTKAYK